MVEAILFDVDGTLMDNNLLHVLAWQRAFRQLGKVVEANPIIHLVGMGGDQLAPRVLEGDPPEVAERARELYKEEYSEKGLVEHSEPLPGAVDLLRAVRGRGARLALASSGEERDVQRYVELLGGPGMFDELVTSADVSATKPEPDVFALALERLGNLAHAIVVGDTVYDIDAARRLGLPCFCVLTGGIERGVLEDAGAAAVYNDAADVLADLDAILDR